MTVFAQIGEVLARHRGLQGSAARTEAARLLVAVGISDPEARLDDYPFQFSGGIKQRVMLAMALAGEPRITSYNVCYTKLLRRALQACNGNL